MHKKRYSNSFSINLKPDVVANAAQRKHRFLVTGASSGIGLATAEALAQLKHSVVAVARSSQALEQLKERSDGQVEVVVADLSTDAGITVLVEAIKPYGQLNGIVHAAGSLIEPRDYDQLDTEQLVNDTHIHVAVPITLNNVLKKVLHESLKGTRIVYIDSYSASTVRIGWGGYSIVKAAAQMAARVAAEEHQQSSIIRVFPGAVRTPLVETVLNWQQASPAVDAFNAMDANGTVVEPSVIGEYIACILCKATDAQLAAREYWDFCREEDRIF